MTMTIRNYCHSDAQSLRQLYFDTVHVVNSQHYTPEQIRAWAPLEFDLLAWQTCMEELQPFIAEIDGVIVGYSDLQSDGLIDHFFCHHAYQGGGVGKALMAHIFKSAQARKINRLYSHVSITARGFYEHMGFYVVQAQKVQLRGQILDNYLMQKLVG